MPATRTTRPIPTGDRARRVVTGLVAATLVVAPEGCSSPGPPAPAAQTTTLIIDGASRTIDGTVVCVAGATGEVSIEVDPPNTTEAAPPAQPIVVLDLTPQGDVPSVSLLSIHLPEIGLTAGRYRSRGVPTAAKSGNTYTVTGEASVVGAPPEAPVYKAFELTLTCP